MDYTSYYTKNKNLFVVPNNSSIDSFLLFQKISRFLLKLKPQNQNQYAENKTESPRIPQKRACYPIDKMTRTRFLVYLAPKQRW